MGSSDFEYVDRKNESIKSDEGEFTEWSEVCKMLEKKSQVMSTKEAGKSSNFRFFMSRENGDLLYNEQDRAKWNKDLIQKGEKYLNLSSRGNIVSKYHLEAGIAYWHYGRY